MRQARAAIATSGVPEPRYRSTTAVESLTVEGAPIFDRILQVGPIFASSAADLPSVESPETEFLLALTRRDVALIYNSTDRSVHLSSCRTLGDALATSAWLKSRPPHQLFSNHRLRAGFPDPLRYTRIDYLLEPGTQVLWRTCGLASRAGSLLVL